MISKEGYERMLQQVASIDPAGAQWIKDAMQRMKDGKLSKDFIIESDNLAGAFTWDSTPQGEEYWSNIHNKIEEGSA